MKKLPTELAEKLQQQGYNTDKFMLVKLEYPDGYICIVNKEAWIKDDEFYVHNKKLKQWSGGGNALIPINDEGGKVIAAFPKLGNVPIIELPDEADILAKEAIKNCDKRDKIFGESFFKKGYKANPNTYSEQDIVRVIELCIKSDLLVLTKVDINHFYSLKKDIIKKLKLSKQPQYAVVEVENDLPVKFICYVNQTESRE